MIVAINTASIMALAGQVKASQLTGPALSCSMNPAATMPPPTMNPSRRVKDLFIYDRLKS